MKQMEFTNLNFKNLIFNINKFIIRCLYKILKEIFTSESFFLIMKEIDNLDN